MISKVNLRARFGSSLLWLGEKIRKSSNRLTTKFLMSEYRLGGSYDLQRMLQNFRPQDLGSPADLKFIAAHSCRMLVEQYLSGTKYRVIPAEVKKFRNGESYARIGETVRGKKVVIVQDFEKSSNLNDTLMETLLLIDAAKRADAQRVILITPYLPYIDEKKGSCNYGIDYFKLVLNLLFKAANLDELRVGNLKVDRQTNTLFLIDKVFSRNVAPYLISNAYEVLSSKNKSKGIVFLFGQNYMSVALKIIRQLKEKYNISGQFWNLNLSFDPHSKINCLSDPKEELVGKTVYIFQSCNTGRINDDFMEALLMIYTARKRGAREIVLVMPYLPYNRQERKAKNREAISAKLVANALVEAAGVTQIITLDPHAPATQGFVDIPFQFITAFHLIADYFKKKIEMGKLSEEKLTSVAPDVGRGKMVRKMGLLLIGPNSSWALIDKDRPAAGEAKVAAMVGKVYQRDILLFDDLGDSAASLINAVKVLKKRGAGKIFVALVHGVFSDVKIQFYDKDGQRKSDAFREYQNILAFLKSNNKKVEDYIRMDNDGFVVNALIRLQAEPNIEEIVFTNSLNVPSKNIIDSKKVKILSIEDLMAVVCGRIIKGESLKGYQYEGA